jgi:ubiquinone/menaquinone biosynthesis C-methylase UbiE
MPTGPLRGHFSRSRSLADFNRKFGKDAVQKEISKALRSQKIVRVLEIGCGEGRVLMELRKLYPQIELHGINKSPWAAMKGSQSLKRTATFYDILTNNELKNARLPKIYFCNAEKLRFKDCFFDLVISQVSIQYVKRKDILLSEIWRVLKKNGVALLNIDSYQEPIPDFLMHETPRFTIFKDGKDYPAGRLFQVLANKGYDIRYFISTEKEKDVKKTRYNVIFRKNKDSPLKLNLKFDDVSSFDLRNINEEKDNWSIYWGYRSVYYI